MSAQLATAVSPVPPAGALRADPGSRAGETPPASPSGSRSYAQILRSSSLIGGSSFVTLGVNIARGKIIASLLGPAGVGVMGLLGSILDLTVSVAGMGINSSGVRQIAEAAGTGDAVRIARTAAVLRRTSLVLGIGGGAILATSSVAVSTWTFGSSEYWGAIVLLALAVGLRIVSDGQAALIQGLRRIGDLARMNVLSTVLGTAATLALVSTLGSAGIAPALAVGAAIVLAIASRFRRRLSVLVIDVTRTELRAEAEPLLKLGFAFMASAVLSTASSYVIRILVRDRLGLDAAGIYQSAWTIGGLYIGFILQAMGSDFYPRLAAAQRHDDCNRLVNEQALVGLLLASPGVVATLTFAPLVVALLYHSSFSAATQPLRWICLGMTLRVWAWPMGYIIMARGERNLLFLVELMAGIVHVGLAVALVGVFGLAGAAMAFAGLYVWHGAFVYVIVHRLTRFRWSRDNWHALMVVGPLVAVDFAVASLATPGVAMAVGCSVLLISVVYSVHRLSTLVPDHALLRRVGRLRASLPWSVGPS